MRVTLALLMVTASLHAEPFLVAHRGASADAPENTIAAFELAWKQGANAIEGDFQLTKDGQIVCIHDDDTKRVAGKNLVVANTTLAELRRLNLNPKGTKGSFKIPTLDEVLETRPDDGAFFIEIKCGPEIVPSLLTTLKASEVSLEQITIIAFNAKVIRALKDQEPNLKANWLCSFKKKLGRTTPTRKQVLHTLRTCGADGLGTNAWPGIDHSLLADLKKVECSHHVWTVDEAATARRFLALGTATVTTNRPAALRSELSE